MKILIGDIFQSRCKTLVNTVNCAGVMGKGVALEFKSRFPDMYADYRRRCERGLVKPGMPYLFEDLLGVSILNFPTKDHWRSPSRLSYVSDGLDWVIDHWSELGLTSVAFPPLGCGNGGLDWDDVGPLMYDKLKDLPGDIELYAPFGTNPDKLEISYLAKGHSSDIEKDGVMQRRYNKQWDLVLHVISELDKDDFAPWIGRTIYQKICYMLARSSVDLGFSFYRGSFGPYSPDAKTALTAFANSNKIKEVSATDGSKLIRLSVSPAFVFDSGAYSEHDLNVASSVIDFFTRVRSTAQAEQYATLVYCYDELRLAKSCSGSCPEEGGRIHSEAVIAEALAWKPHWNDGQTPNVLREELRALSSLGWVRVVDDGPSSDELPF